ncbi:unnamed protein product [[Candida] boidinii]|nr:unnamed protein product [[Candida] boidinii]
MFLFDKFRSQPSSYKRKKLYKFGEILGVGSFGSVRYGEIIRTSKFSDITSDDEDNDYEDYEDDDEYEKDDENYDNDLNNDKIYDKVAIKIISKKLLEKNKDENSEESIIDEINLLKQLNHKNIVKFIDSFESKDSYYIITELATGGELFDRIVEKTVFTETDAASIIYQLLNGVNYLHNNGIIHRDLKPENILFKTKNDNSDIVIADFGIAKKIQNFNNANSDDSDLENQQRKPYLLGYAGSFGYSAPETYTDEGYSYPADIWSIGVITYTLLAGLIPFRSETVVDFLDEVQAPNSGVIFYDEYWNHISNSAKDFILCALELDQDKRLSAKELLNHRWITSHIQSNKVDTKSEIVCINNNGELHSPLNRKSSLEFLEQVDTVVENPTESKHVSKIISENTSEGTLGIFQDDDNAAVSEYNLMANKRLRSNLRSMKKFKKIIRIVMMKNRFKKLRKELKSQGEEDTKDYGFDDDDDDDDEDEDDIEYTNDRIRKVSLKRGDNEDENEDEDDDDESSEDSYEEGIGLGSKSNYTYKKMYRKLRSGVGIVAATARRGSGCFDKEKKAESNFKDEATFHQLT